MKNCTLNIKKNGVLGFAFLITFPLIFSVLFFIHKPVSAAAGQFVLPITNDLFFENMSGLDRANFYNDVETMKAKLLSLHSDISDKQGYYILRSEASWTTLYFVYSGDIVTDSNSLIVKNISSDFFDFSVDEPFISISAFNFSSGYTRFSLWVNGAYGVSYRNSDHSYFTESNISRSTTFYWNNTQYIIPLDCNFIDSSDHLIWQPYAAIDPTLDKLLNFAPSFSPVGDILSSGFHQGENLTTWNFIKNLFPSYTNVSSSDPIIDQILGHLRNFLYYLGQLFYYILRIYDSLQTFLLNFWTNLKNLFGFLANALIGIFSDDSDQQQDNFFTWFDSAFARFGQFLEGNICKWLFGDTYELALDSDHRFSIFLWLRRMIIPDNLNDIKNFVSNKLSIEMNSASGLYSEFLSSYTLMVRNVSSGVVPTINLPSWSIHGITFDSLTISLQFLDPYMPTIRAFLAVWIWLSFIVYFIQIFPSIWRGLSTSFDVGMDYSGWNDDEEVL